MKKCPVCKNCCVCKTCQQSRIQEDLELMEYLVSTDQTPSPLEEVVRNLTTKNNQIIKQNNWAICSFNKSLEEYFEDHYNKKKVKPTRFKSSKDFNTIDTLSIGSPIAVSGFPKL